MVPWIQMLRRGLDALYFASGVAAAICLIAILSLIVLQMLARWFGEVFPGAPDYAGYAMAAASFLAFAHALNRGSHIRVSLVLNAASPGVRRWIEVWCFAVGAGLAWYFTYFAGQFVYWSWKFNDISQGQDATPLWIPQSAMLVGAVVFAIALTDHLVNLIVTGAHRIEGEDIDADADETSGQGAGV
ncbi:MAG: TRAP transporter small permease [Pseudomonadota bacterium]